MGHGFDFASVRRSFPLLPYQLPLDALEGCTTSISMEEAYWKLLLRLPSSSTKNAENVVAPAFATQTSTDSVSMPQGGFSTPVSYTHLTLPTKA